MKKLFTKLMAITALLLLTSWNLAAINYHPITAVEEFQTTDVNIAAADWVTYIKASYSDRTKCYTGKMPNLSATDRFVNFTISGCKSFTINADGNSTVRYYTYSINGATSIQTASWPDGCTSQTFETGNTGDITLSIAGVSGSVYLASVIFTPPASPLISAFSAAGIDATIDQTAKTITAELPFGTNLTSIEPIVTIGGVATSYSPTGAQDFSAGAVTYSAIGTTTVNYTVTLTASAVANTDATLSDLQVDGATVAAFNPATLTYDVALPYAYVGLPVISSTVNAVTSNQVLVQASAIPGSATVTVTAQDNTSKVYTINFTRTPASSACDITSLMINNRLGVISGTDILVQLHNTTDVTALSPVIAVSTFANVTPSGSQNFSSPVQYTVTAEDGTQKIYTVSVELIDMRYSGSYPLITNFPTGYTIPLWMSSPTNAISFEEPYTGSDKALWYDNETETTAAAASVIRLSSSTAIEFMVSKCESVTAKLSATGTRVFDMYINGSLVATSGSIGSNTLVTLTYAANLNEPVTIKIDNPSSSGGITLGYLEITASFGSDLKVTQLKGVSFDGTTIHNANNIKLNVYDITGRIVKTSTKDIQMTGIAKGTYIVRSNDAVLKIALVK